MKKIKRITITFVVFTVFLLMLVSPQAMTQTPHPPNNGTTGSGGETPVGGGAPIGGRIMILLTMGFLWGI